MKYSGKELIPKTNLINQYQLIKEHFGLNWLLDTSAKSLNIQLKCLENRARQDAHLSLKTRNNNKPVIRVQKEYHQPEGQRN